eukprot:g468.t1
MAAALDPRRLDAPLDDDEGEDVEGTSMLGQLGQWVSGAFSSTKSAAWGVSKFGGSTAWVVATTLAITLVPLVIEIEREQGMEQLQQLQMEQLKSQGYTQQELAQMGFSPDKVGPSAGLDTPAPTA